MAARPRHVHTDRRHLELGPLQQPCYGENLFSLTRPSDQRLQSVLQGQSAEPFSHAEVGASRHPVLPSGYNVDCNRIKLGTGMSAFKAAKAAMKAWKMFDRAWLRVFPENAQIHQGSTVAIVAFHCGFYSINVCRIVYVLDSEEQPGLFGFAYGTLSEHAESGEERFTVTRDASDDSIWYEIVAFSRPRALLARIGYPISRAMQRRFARSSLAAMRG